MNFCQRLFIKLITGIITFFVIYQLIGLLLFKDIAVSVEPGWHTPIYPGGRLYFTIIIIICTISSCFLFKYLQKFAVYAWIKIFSKNR